MSDSDKIRSATSSSFTPNLRRDWIASASLGDFQDELFSFPLSNVPDADSKGRNLASSSNSAPSNIEEAKGNDSEPPDKVEGSGTVPFTVYPWSASQEPSKQQPKSAPTKASLETTNNVGANPVAESGAKQKSGAGKGEWETSAKTAVSTQQQLAQSQRAANNSLAPTDSSSQDRGTRTSVASFSHTDTSSVDPLGSVSSSDPKNNSTSERAERLAENRGDRKRSKDGASASRGSANSSAASQASFGNPIVSTSSANSTEASFSAAEDVDSTTSEGSLPIPEEFTRVSQEEVPIFNLDSLTAMLPSLNESAGDLLSGTTNVSLPHGTATQVQAVDANLPNANRVDGRGMHETVSGSKSTLSRFQESKLVQRVAQSFEQLEEGGGQVRVRLHPPELGTLQLTLRIEAMQVSAKLEVENSAARDALVSNAAALRDRLSKLGMEVEQFEVEIRPELASGGGKFQSGFQGEDRSEKRTLESRYAIQQSNRTGPSSGATQSRVGWIRNGNNLDLTV